MMIQRRTIISQPLRTVKESMVMYRCSGKIIFILFLIALLSTFPFGITTSDAKIYK